MKAVVAAFNQEKALVGAFSVIVQPIVEPMDRFTALMVMVLMRVLQVMLLVMMITFFKLPPSKPPGPAVHLEQPERVERVHQFYLDKLHAYLHLR